MLVLSRRKNQQINFPGLGIRVEILETSRSTTKIGVHAPLEVRVLRGELEGGNAPHVVRLPEEMRHEIRNVLHEVSLMLHVYRKRTEAAPAERVPGIDADPAAMFEAIVRRLESLRQHRSLRGTTADVVDARALAPASSDPAGPSALVVDDNANERELLSGFLRMCSYDVAGVGDGHAAIDYLTEHETPSVIVLDMHMPNCNGVGFLHRLAEEGLADKTSVFVVSGSTPKEVGLTDHGGYVRWFPKPLDPRRIVSALTEVEARRTCVA